MKFWSIDVLVEGWILWQEKFIILKITLLNQMKLKQDWLHALMI